MTAKLCTYSVDDYIMITKVVLRKYSKASANLRESERKLSELEGKGQEMELKVGFRFFCAQKFTIQFTRCCLFVKCQMYTLFRLVAWKN